MEILIDHSIEGGALALLSGELTIEHAHAAHRALLDAVACHPQVEFDLAAVSALDAAGLQLLMLCKREAAQLGHRLQLSRHSAVVVDQFERFNLAGYFGDPLVLLAGDCARDTP